jgi:hypothetical protein
MEKMMLLQYFGRMILAFVLMVSISSEVVAVSSRNTPPSNFADHLSENAGWQVCKIIEVRACVDCNSGPISTYKLKGECGKKETTFISASFVYKNTYLLVANLHAERLLIQEHSSGKLHGVPERIIRKSDLDIFSSAFRIVSIDVNHQNHSYVLISGRWSMKKIDTNAYGAVFKNLNMRLKCGPTDCPPEQVKFFVLPIEELNKLRAVHPSK